MYNIQNMQKIQKIENKVRKANIKLPIQVTHKKTKITLRLAEQWKAPRTWNAKHYECIQSGSYNNNDICLA